MKLQLRVSKTTGEAVAIPVKTVWPSTPTVKFGAAITISLEIIFRATEVRVSDAHRLKSNCTRWAIGSCRTSASVVPRPPMAVLVYLATRVTVVS